MNSNEDALALIVEDDANLANIFSQALDKAGFQTEIVTDGRLAKEKITTLMPQVVVLDLHLPGLSGEALLNYIRSDSRLKDVQVILATADAVWAEALRDEADLVLQKPISYRQLRDLSARLLKLK